jgi:hypothetical protein
VNAPFHQGFEELVALFYADELTDEEWDLLQIHMAYCDSCRDVFDQLAQVSNKAIPVLAAASTEEIASMHQESEESFAASERRLLDSLRESETTDKPRSAPLRKSLIVCLLAACLIGAAAYLSFLFVHPSRANQSLVATKKPANLPPIRSVAAQSSEAVPRETAEVQSAIQANPTEVLAAQRKADIANAALNNVQQQLDRERTEQETLTTQRDDLERQLAETKNGARDLQQKLDQEQQGSGERVNQTNVLQAKVRELNVALEDANTALENKERMLSLDKDLLTHDRDIRDLMGARSLYIADIFDTNANGSTAKPFGRIFYTQDKSLIFYGFDLEKQVGIKQASAFQAWGSGAARQPVSLGVFYQDDSHKRWVLRCNDATTLARLNMVFVTVEPPGGSNKPTGKQLLRAYLQIQPNHP